MRNKNAFLIVYIALFIFATFVYGALAKLLMTGNYASLGGDSYQYIILARNLASGGGYRAINYPHNPFFSHYPPFFPLLLVPAAKMANNFFSFKLTVALCGYLAILLTGWFFLRIKKAIAFLLVALMATNIYFLHYAIAEILSDVPFLAFSMAAIFFFFFYLSKKRAVSWEGVGASVFLIMAFFTRYIGITLFLSFIISIFLYSSCCRLKKAGFIAFTFILFAALWQIIIFLNKSTSFPASAGVFALNPYEPAQGTIFQHPFLFLWRCLDMFFYYLKLSGKLILPFFYNLPDSACYFFGLAVFIIVLRGMYVSYQRKIGFLNVYFIVYLLILIFWPYREGERFLVPILPFFYFYLLSAIFSVKSKLLKICFVVFLLSVNILSLPQREISSSLAAFPSYVRNFFLANIWAQKNLPPQALLSSRKPRLTYFYSGHKAVAYPFTKNPKETWEFFKKNNIDYLIVDNFSRETYLYIAPFLQKYREKLKLLYRIGNTGIFKIKTSLFHPTGGTKVSKNK